MRKDLAVGMKEEPCVFLFKDCRPAFRFDYRGDDATDSVCLK
jgi:hypothetical protein